MAELNRNKEVPAAMEMLTKASDALKARAASASTPLTRKDEQELAALYTSLTHASLTVATAIGWHRPIP